MVEVTEDEFRLILSQWREKKSVIHVWALYPDDRMRQFSCVVQEVADNEVVLVTEDGWLHVFPFSNATFSYDTPDTAPPRIKASVANKFNSAVRVDWVKKDTWIMYESIDALPGGAPVSDPASN